MKKIRTPDIIIRNEKVKSNKIHQKAYHHIRRHKRKYIRFLTFFVFLIIYSVIEDLIAVTIHGVEFDLIVLVNVFVIALVFTGIAELTERFYKKEEDEIKDVEKKVEKFVKKEEDFIEDEEKLIEKKIKKSKVI